MVHVLGSYLCRVGHRKQGEFIPNQILNLAMVINRNGGQTKAVVTKLNFQGVCFSKLCLMLNREKQ